MQSRRFSDPGNALDVGKLRGLPSDVDALPGAARRIRESSGDAPDRRQPPGARFATDAHGNHSDVHADRAQPAWSRRRRISNGFVTTRGGPTFVAPRWPDVARIDRRQGKGSDIALATADRLSHNEGQA